MKTIVNKRAKQVIQTDEPVSVEMQAPRGAVHIRSAKMSDGYEDFGFFDGDEIIYDTRIEPVPGEPAIYEYTADGEIFYTVEKYVKPTDGEKKDGGKYLGMITHVLRRVYESPYKILNAEFLSVSDEE